MAGERRPPLPDDEPFWQAQETRLAGQLGQPCCSVSGMATLLGRLSGNLALIVHGERDCAASFVAHQWQGAHRVYCTGVTEEQATLGRSHEPLRRCLELVLAEQRPDAVLILETCLLKVIGADPAGLVEEVAARTDVPIRLLRTGGLRLSTQAAMADELYETLAGLPQRPPGDRAWRARLADALAEARVRLLTDGSTSRDEARRQIVRAADQVLREPAACCNLIGLPEPRDRHSELEEVLEGAGIQVNGLYPGGATLEDWRGISHADTSLVADLRLYPRLVELLRSAYGLAVTEVPLPIGLGQTRRFYRRLGEATGRLAAVEARIAPLETAAAERVAALAARARGLRLALGLRMLNNYRADQLAYDGLGDVEALAELGFEITLLVQGAPEEEARLGELLERLGCDRPFHVFPSPWELAPILREGGFDLAYLADHAREEALAAGIPMIESRDLLPFFAGIGPNLDALEALLRAAGRSP